MTDTVEDHIDAARKMRELVEKLADCTDPRQAPSVEDELEAFAWFIAEARAIVGVEALEEPPEPTQRLGITDAMIEEAMTRTKAQRRDRIVRMLNDAAGVVETPSDCVDLVVTRYEQFREAWKRQDALRGEAWKKAHPNWRG